VTNAGCRDKDRQFLDSSISNWLSAGKEAVELNCLSDRGLIALQGPLAVSILQSILSETTPVNLAEFYFGSCHEIKLAISSGPSGMCLASRGGYTGEDGFEISVPAHELSDIVHTMLEKAGKDRLRLAGLGARDSLRLEAGMCLYGHDIDDSTTPIEAGLSWIVGKERRIKGGFNGDQKILAQLTPVSKGGEGVARRRVGLIVQGAPAREGAKILDSTGEAIGVVTSGCPSPSLNQNIAMGYVKNGHHTAGTVLDVVIRGKKRQAVVSKMPFLPSKYWKGGVSPA